MGKHCAIRCHCGFVCPQNRGCLLADPGRGIYCVCNGVSHEPGDALASHLLRTEIGRAVATAPSLAEKMPAVGRAAERTATILRAKAMREGLAPMAATFAAFLAGPAESESRSAAVGWIGNCRVYRYRAGNLECLTRDHTVGNEPRLRQPSLKAKRAWGCLGALTRIVGLDEAPRVEWRCFDTEPDDGYLVCTEGVYRMLREVQIASAFSEVCSAESVADRIESGIVRAGAVSNYSMIVCRK